MTTKSSESNTISFRYGIPGFEFLTQFVIEEIEGHAPFHVLKSIENSEISMLILDVKFIKTTVDIEIPKHELEQMKFNGSGNSKMAVYAVLKYDKESQSFTVNMKAPIVVNPTELLGQQIILVDDRLTVNQPLILL